MPPDPTRFSDRLKGSATRPRSPNRRKGARGAVSAAVPARHDALIELVRDRQAGWWAVYQERKVLGYVAGSVLGDQPAAAPPDSGRGRGIGG